MFDPDPAKPVLRLGLTDKRPVAPTADAAATAEHEMRDAIMRWVEAVMEWHSIAAQAAPISAQHGTGPDPLIFRSSGHVERLQAAARGEIGDPAEDLRRERLVMALNGFEPLDAPL